MAGSVNKAIIVGHLGRDPEIRYIDSGKAVTNLSVATSERWKDQSGKPQERTEWHRVQVWGSQAESCAEYLHSGSLVYVEGRIQTRQYEQDGVTKYSTEVVARDVRFLGGKQDGAPGPKQKAAPATSGGKDDDIPF